MKLEQRTSITQNQKLSLTPEIKQSLTILQLPLAELQIYLSEQVEENCFLEFEKDTVPDDVEETLSDAASLINDPGDVLWEDYTQTRDSSMVSNLENTDTQNFVSSNFTESANLREHLLLQLHLTSLSSPEQHIGEYLIENINNDGYLCCELDEVARILNTDISNVEHVLRYIQAFEPAGVGARSISECLILQLKVEKKPAENQETNDLFDLALYIIENYLNEVADGQVSRIAKSIHRPVADVSKAIVIIKKLNPIPGRHFENNIRPSYIFPDVTVKKVDHRFIVEVMEASSEKLRINNYYRQLLANRGNIDSDTVNFLKDRYNAALWLIKCLDQRKTTIHKITTAIIQVQQEFLENDASFLKPLTLQKISEMVELDASTISRAIKGKYMQTPRGIYAFKYFLSSGINTVDGDTISSKSIKKIIQEVISAEESNTPLSDQMLADILKAKGIVISRRTITKYRKELLIPDSRKRRSIQ